jgi:hypothetical protein
MEEIIHRLHMNCPFLTTLDLSNMDDKWYDPILLALKNNTHLKKIKVKNNDKRVAWLRISKHLEVYFVDNFVAIEGGEGVVYHIFKAD